jgi:GMP synthase (glutamine-hydrolysing)
MILILDLCSESLSHDEFVLPIAAIVKKEGFNYTIHHYTDVTIAMLAKASHIILCGTAIKDDTYLADINLFDWLQTIEKPVFGICAGMQMIGLQFGAELQDATEIGMTKITGTLAIDQGYSLHRHCITLPEGFEELARSKECIQAIQHEKKPLLGLLFHPEVANKELIMDFLKTG